MLRRKKCGFGSKAKKCSPPKPRRRAKAVCDTSSIEHMLYSAGYTAMFAKNNPVELARAKDKYLLAGKYARAGGKACSQRWAKRFARFRKDYPNVTKARLRDAYGPGLYVE